MGGGNGTPLFGLVYSIDDGDPIEVAIQRMIEGAQRMIRVNISNSSEEEEQSEITRINPAMKRHFELDIETLKNAPRDEGKYCITFALLRR